MAKRKNNPLDRKEPRRPYRKVCWVSAEGSSERDYLSMNAFKGLPDATVKFPVNIHPNRRNPSQVLARFRKSMAKGFRPGDEAWLVVDVDTWDKGEFDEIFAWAESNPSFHLAISNPKFELFLVMHFERANGCTTASVVDERLKHHMPSYKKRIRPTQFNATAITKAVENARLKRAGCKDRFPQPGTTDAHLLVARLLNI